MKVITYGNPVLRKRARKIKNIDKKIIMLSSEMLKIMETNKPQGIGLAAPQVGISIAMFVYKLDDDQGIVINPEIIHKKGKATTEEGCLSIPGIYGPVERAEEITVRGLNIKGKRIEWHLSGLKARVFQHETDHLHGILFTDYIKDIDKLEVEEGYELPKQLLERFKGE